MSALEEQLISHKPIFCTCGMDDNMHETVCAKYLWAVAWYELGQLRSESSELSSLKSHLLAIYDGLAKATGYASTDDAALLAGFDPHEAIQQLQERIAEQAAQLEQARETIRRVWNLADFEISRQDVATDSNSWQIEADTRAWLAVNAPEERK